MVYDQIELTCQLSKAPSRSFLHWWWRWLHWMGVWLETMLYPVLFWGLEIEILCSKFLCLFCPFLWRHLLRTWWKLSGCTEFIPECSQGMSTTTLQKCQFDVFFCFFFTFSRKLKTGVIWNSLLSFWVSSFVFPSPNRELSLNCDWCFTQRDL